MKNFRKNIDKRTWGVLGKQQTYYSPAKFLGEKVPLNANPLDSWDVKRSRFRRIDLVPKQNDGQQGGAVPQDVTSVPVITPSVTATPTNTPGLTPSVTPTLTSTPTVTPTSTVLPADCVWNTTDELWNANTNLWNDCQNVPPASPTPSVTATPTITPSITPTTTITPTASITPSVTITQTPFAACPQEITVSNHTTTEANGTYSFYGIGYYDGLSSETIILGTLTGTSYVVYVKGVGNSTYYIAYTNEVFVSRWRVLNYNFTNDDALQVGSITSGGITYPQNGNGSNSSYLVYPAICPSSTPTNTPTVTNTPTTTVTPTISLTPSVTATIALTPTPSPTQPAFSPNQISNLQLWFDASSGSSASSWTNYGLLGGSLTQGTAILQPQTKTSVFGSWTGTTMRFTGRAQMIGTFTNTNYADSTLFAVIKQVTRATSGDLIGWRIWNGSTSVFQQYLQKQTTGGLLGFNFPFSGVSYTGSTLLGIPALVSIETSGTTAGTAFTDLEINDATQVLSSGGTSFLSGTTVIFGDQNSFASGLNRDLEFAEFIVYNKLLNPTEFLQVENYLKTKYQYSSW